MRDLAVRWMDEGYGVEMWMDEGYGGERWRDIGWRDEGYSGERLRDGRSGGEVEG